MHLIQIGGVTLPIEGDPVPGFVRRHDSGKTVSGSLAHFGKLRLAHGTVEEVGGSRLALSQNGVNVRRQKFSLETVSLTGELTQPTAGQVIRG